MLSARLPDLQLEQVPAPRSARGKRWQLTVLLTTVLAGMLAGCTSLLGVEQLTGFMTRAVRRLLGIARRASRYHDAHGAVRADAGSDTVADPPSDPCCPSPQEPDAQRACGRGGCLATFPHCISELRRVYGHLDLFQWVAADAGSCSQENGQFARSSGLHYLFGLKCTQPTLFAEASRVLEPRSAELADAFFEDFLSGDRKVVRRLYLTAELAGYHWEHLQTVVRIESQTFDHGRCVQQDNRYYVCSMAVDSLSPEQWLTLVRRAPIPGQAAASLSQPALG
jgi:hypothetical protein